MGYFIYQLKDNDCGIASLKMLLATIYKRKDFLYYPQDKVDKQYSFNDLMQIAQKEGVTLTAYRVMDKEELFKGKGDFELPILVTLNFKECRHMVLVKKIYKNSLKIYDPKKGIYRMKKKDFFNLWEGFILEISEIKGSNFKASKVNVLPKSFMFLSLFFELLSFIALFLGMFFVNENYSFLIPLLLFVFFVIFEFVYQKIVILSLKYFDNKLLYDDFLRNKNSFKDYYEDMNKYKVELVSTPIKYLSSGIIIIFGMFLLGINSYFSLINLGIIFIIQIIFKLLEKRYLLKKRNELGNLEHSLIKSETLKDDEFKEKLETLNNETYNIVSLTNFKKYFLMFLTIILCLLFLGFSGNITLNFLLFHFFMYIFLEDNFEKILSISDSIEKIKTYKCLYLYHFSK
ncbi:MAG: hypothetical protein IAC58_06340 [Firmicutes bacterium]|uniref:Peptidase C39 domain-containing protein n=1 Tax=Candidatus Onthovivens merdipullorum TaxID=2840889 RepID=A0A9D9DJ41_9BACL|nr:hypothetical protein [Candidatus Onthovivens merdipullorum]